jgi:hypothetical protein
MFAVSAPTMLGLKVTEIVQVAPEATIVPHVLEAKKSAAFPPVTVIPFTERKAVPVLVTVMDFVTLVATVWLPNARLAGANVNAGEAEEPLASGVQVLVDVQPYRFEPGLAEVLKKS